MTHAHLRYDDRVAAATLSETTAVAGLPISNLQDPQSSKLARWQSTSAFGPVIVLEWCRR